MRIFIAVLLFGTLFACSDVDTADTETPESTSTESDTTKVKSVSALTYKAIFLGELGWGYQVFRGSKLLINQEHVPAVNGLHGFSTEAHAERAAQLVIEKFKEGWDKPTVTPEELDSIGAINLDSLVQLTAPK